MTLHEASGIGRDWWPRKWGPVLLAWSKSSPFSYKSLEGLKSFDGVGCAVYASSVSG